MAIIGVNPNPDCLSNYGAIGVNVQAWIMRGIFEGHDEAWGKTQFEDYVAHHYHQPSDEFQESWDFRGNARLARFGFVLGWLASAQPHSIQWHAGDEFEAPRKKSVAQ